MIAGLWCRAGRGAVSASRASISGSTSARTSRPRRMTWPAHPGPPARARASSSAAEGPRQTPALAARFADEFNTGLGLGAGLPERFAYFRRVVTEHGRDPAAIRLSTTLPVCCAATRAEAERRKEFLGEAGARLLSAGVVGVPGVVIERLEQLSEAPSTPCTSTSTTWITSTRCACSARRWFRVRRLTADTCGSPPRRRSRHRNCRGLARDAGRRVGGRPRLSQPVGLYLTSDAERPRLLRERLVDLGERRLADMDATGIDHQVISLTTPGPQIFNAGHGRPWRRWPTTGCPRHPGGTPAGSTA